MRALLFTILGPIFCSAPLIGCGTGDRPVAETEEAPVDVTEQGVADTPAKGPMEKQSAAKESKKAHPHSHEGNGKLVWIEKDVPYGEFVLSLGHYGDHLHAGSDFEPALSITKDGVEVDDVKVSVSLLSASGGNVVGKEVATAYEPATEDKPGHYAQARLKLPKTSPLFLLRFRIVLPEGGVELVRDVGLVVEK